MHPKPAVSCATSAETYIVQGIEVQGKAACRWGRGAVVAGVAGTVTYLNQDGTEVVRRSIVGDALTAICAGKDGTLVVGSEAGELFRLQDPRAPADRVASLGRTIYGVHSDIDGTLIATTGIEEFTQVARDGAISCISCDLNTFGVAAGRVRGEIVLAGVDGEDGGLVHIGARGTRVESIYGICSLGFARSPMGALYALGSNMNGLMLLDYRVIPPGDGAEVRGLGLRTVNVKLDAATIWGVVRSSEERY